MTWTLLIFIFIGTVSFDIKPVSVPMQNRAACEAAGKNMQKDGEASKILFICVSSETGAVFQVKP